MRFELFLCKFMYYIYMIIIIIIIIIYYPYLLSKGRKSQRTEVVRGTRVGRQDGWDAFSNKKKYA